MKNLGGVTRRSVLVGNLLLISIARSYRDLVPNREHSRTIKALATVSNFFPVPHSFASLALCSSWFKNNKTIATEPSLCKVHESLAVEVGLEISNINMW